MMVETNKWMARIVPEESDKLRHAGDLESRELHCVHGPTGVKRANSSRAGQVIDLHQIQCEGCGEATPSHDIVTYGAIDSGHRLLCSRCFNAEVARLNGLEDFEHFRFEPIGLVDCAGDTHQFHFRTRLLGHIVVLDAFELRDGYPSGYQCEMVGGPEDDLLGLLGRLVEKLRRVLSVKHLTNDDPEPQIAAQTVRGRIDWDDSAVDRTPLLVIDGREISWNEFGRMLMAFEGWQFTLKIVDRSDEA